MSIVFFIPNAPTETVEVSCLCAQMAPRFSDHFDGIVSSDDIRDELREHAASECLSCQGSGMLIEEHPPEGSEVGFANSNASVFLQLMGFDGRAINGAVATCDIPSVIRNLVRVVNSPGTRGAFVEDATFMPPVSGHMAPVSEGNIVRLRRVGGSAALYSHGRSDEQIVYGAKQLIALFRKAQSDGSDVFWA